MQEGDMVFFPKGMKCVWKIIEPIEKHYIFED
ncbi:MAG: cupin domain-containing protein [Gammaproteobacteria bacterium]